VSMKVKAGRQHGSKNKVDDASPRGVADRVQTELAALQGYWEEIQSGLTIKVEDGGVDFHDGEGVRELSEDPDGLRLKGAVLAGGLPDLAVWRLADGTEAMVWARAPHVEDDPTYAATFYRFKLHRSILRTKLVQALAAEDYRAAAGMQEAWQSTWGAGEQAAPQQELRLARGRFFVPGVCVRHKVFDFRAVVLGCEPWIRAPVLKMMSEDERVSPNLPCYRLQPVYCCLVDDRDVPGGGCTFALEDDLEIAPDVYPLQSSFAQHFLEAQDSIQGYLPGVRLKAAMKLQSVGLPFILRE